MSATDLDPAVISAASEAAELEMARQEVATLREELRLAQITPRVLLERINVGGRPDGDRLLVMAQNPANNHHWSRAVSTYITVGELRAALANGVS